MQQQQQSMRTGPAGRTPRETGNAEARGRQFPTRQYLPANVRSSMIEALNQALADTADLRTQAKFAHWNVRGMQFYQLHLLFDEIAEVLETHEDELAERATALGGQALGTTRMAATNSRIQEIPSAAVTGQEFLQLLADRMAAHDANLGEAMERASQQGDDDTADLLNEISRDVSKYRWFLEAHLQAPPSTQHAGNAQGL